MKWTIKHDSYDSDNEYIGSSPELITQNQMEALKALKAWMPNGPINQALVVSGIYRVSWTRPDGSVGTDIVTVEIE